MWEFDKWSFTLPTDPPGVVIDTRTQRDYDDDEGSPRLLGKCSGGLASLEALIKDASLEEARSCSWFLPLRCSVSTL